MINGIKQSFETYVYGLSLSTQAIDCQVTSHEAFRGWSAKKSLFHASDGKLLRLRMIGKKSPLEIKRLYSRHFFHGKYPRNVNATND